MIVDAFDASTALAHEVRSDDVGVAPVTSLHQHIGLDDVDELERRKNRTKSKVRARVEHPIGVIKRCSALPRYAIAD